MNTTPGQPVAGEPFTIAVDTTPSLFRRPETIGLPVFAGRGLTLQRRIDGDTWETMGRSSVGPDGMGYFSGVTASTGTVVYRVVADEIATDGNRIGWIQTFPTYVTVLRPGAATRARRRRHRRETPTRRRRLPCRGQAAGDRRARRTTGGASKTASGRYGWYPTLWDYSWEAGQSLTSPADFGSVRTGSWLDYADGAGRVSQQNAGLYLDSQRDNGGGPGDFGTTRATLKNSAQAYGRWEVRLRLKSAEADDPDFKVLVELVPDDPADYACGRRNITLAEVAAHSSTLTFGAKADTAQWAATKSIPSLITALLRWRWRSRRATSPGSGTASRSVPS